MNLGTLKTAVDVISRCVPARTPAEVYKCLLIHKQQVYGGTSECGAVWAMTDSVSGDDILIQADQLDKLLSGISLQYPPDTPIEVIAGSHSATFICGKSHVELATSDPHLYKPAKLDGSLHGWSATTSADLVGVLRSAVKFCRPGRPLDKCLCLSPDKGVLNIFAGNGSVMLWSQVPVEPEINASPVCIPEQIIKQALTMLDSDIELSWGDGFCLFTSGAVNVSCGTLSGNVMNIGKMEFWTKDPECSVTVKRNDLLAVLKQQMPLMSEESLQVSLTVEGDEMKFRKTSAGGKGDCAVTPVSFFGTVDESYSLEYLMQAAGSFSSENITIRFPLIQMNSQVSAHPAVFVPEGEEFPKVCVTPMQVR